MSIGPTIIFDKSALQGLSADESMWLENFFISNITPMFFIETLADLEKEVRSGRTPEDIVGNIAHKTPDMGCVAVHYRNLISGELMGQGVVEMTGRPIVAGGRTVELEGKKGVIFQESPEIEATRRWEKKEFLQIERGIAKGWRQELASLQAVDVASFEKFFELLGKPKTFEDLKKKVDMVIDEMNNETFLSLGLELMGMNLEGRTRIIERWKQSGSKPIREFAPYFSYVFSIDLFFHIGTASNLFNSFPHAQTHKIDMAYLYYLPFCHIFTSSDKIHITLAPIFMRSDQTFISGNDLKADFAKLDTYYDALPEEVKNRGSMVFAPCPPDDASFLTTQLWDKYMSKTWRSLKDNMRKFDGTDKIDPEVEKAILEQMKKFVNESKTISPDELPNSDEADSMMLRHMVSTRKGKWKKFPPEVINSRSIF